jgi:hypothetical protein
VRYTARMEFMKIVGGCVLAAICYGILHDQVTARICLEYFTVFHPPVFPTQNPTLLALGWGIIATWWMGAGIGLLLAVSARLGRWPPMSARELTARVIRLLALMACCAAVFGAIGYFAGQMPRDLSDLIAASSQRRFLADWWAHMASYASGFFGGLGLCVVVLVERSRNARRPAFVT